MFRLGTEPFAVRIFALSKGQLGHSHSGSYIQQQPV
jgi:hypothetical protein